jgi:regulator of protease activity HflC (stomatin/prohibitin superfamily)
MQLVRLPRSVDQRQFPGNPEQVFKGDDKATLPSGMVRPIRVVTGDGDVPEEQRKPLQDRATLTVSFFTQFVITHPLCFLVNFKTFDRFIDQVRDAGETVLSERASEGNAADFVDNQVETNGILDERIETRFRNSGVNILHANMISPDISHETSEELAKITRARAKVKQTIIRSEGIKVYRTKKGEGDGLGEKARLSGRAAGMKAMKTDLGIEDGEVVIAAEVARAIADKTDVILAGAEGGMRDIVGMAKGVQAGLNAGKKEKSA